jgi:effector-binding domain-containing protein
MKQQVSFFRILLIVSSFLFFYQTSNAMEKKTIEKTTVLMYSLNTTLAAIKTDPGEIPNEIVTKATELGLEITGPQIWQYSGADGKPETVFKLDICLPVKEAKGDAGKFRFEVLPEVTCISEIHKGSWSDLGNTYQRVFGEISRKGIIPTDVCREVYHICDFVNEANNMTEIQVVIH